jgi:uncharacterized protein YcfJ
MPVEPRCAGHQSRGGGHQHDPGGADAALHDVISGESRVGTNHRKPDCCSDWHFRRTTMKPLIICTAVLGIALAPAAAEAKGCIKGAIVGGIAGHMAGHGKVGVVAGCIIGHHEANKRDANRTDQKPPPPAQDNHI